MFVHGDNNDKTIQYMSGYIRVQCFAQLKTFTPFRHTFQILSQEDSDYHISHLTIIPLYPHVYEFHIWSQKIRIREVKKVSVLLNRISTFGWCMLIPEEYEFLNRSSKISCSVYTFVLNKLYAIHRDYSTNVSPYIFTAINWRQILRLILKGRINQERD